MIRLFFSVCKFLLLILYNCYIIRCIIQSYFRLHCDRISYFIRLSFPLPIVVSTFSCRSRPPRLLIASFGQLNRISTSFSRRRFVYSGLHRVWSNVTLWLSIKGAIAGGEGIRMGIDIRVHTWRPAAAAAAAAVRVAIGAIQRGGDDCSAALRRVIDRCCPRPPFATPVVAFEPSFVYRRHGAQDRP